MLFIEIAILSGDKPNHQFVHHVNENMKVKNWCQNPGILFAKVFHQYIQAFSANILGIYIYSWLASQAVEYGVNEFCIHIYKYANDNIIGKDRAIIQILFDFQNDFDLKLNFSLVSHIL